MTENLTIYVNILSEASLFALDISETETINGLKRAVFNPVNGSETQRWLYSADGSFTNLKTGEALEATDTADVVVGNTATNNTWSIRQSVITNPFLAGYLTLGNTTPGSNAVLIEEAPSDSKQRFLLFPVDWTSCWIQLYPEASPIITNKDNTSANVGLSAQSAFPTNEELWLTLSKDSETLPLQFISLLNGDKNFFAIDNSNAEGSPTVSLQKADDTKTLWIPSRLSGTKNVLQTGDTEFYLRPAEGNVSLQLVSGGIEEDNNNNWYIKVALPIPNGSTDVFQSLLPGQAFRILYSDKSKGVLSYSSSKYQLVPLDTQSKNQIWYYKDGTIINIESGLAIFLTDTAATGSDLVIDVLPIADSNRSQAKWIFSPEGFIMSQYNHFVVGESDSQQIIAQPYSIAQPQVQHWYLDFISGDVTASFPKKSAFDISFSTGSGYLSKTSNTIYGEFVDDLDSVLLSEDPTVVASD